MVGTRWEFERVRGVKSHGQSRSAGYIFRQKVEWVTSESGDGRAEKPRYDVPQGVGVKNRCKAELTNHRGQRSRCILLYRTAVARNGCGMPFPAVCLFVYITYYVPGIL